MNPFFEREHRSRFRGRGAFGWLFLLVGALALVIYLCYGSWFDARGELSSRSDSRLFYRVGGDLFSWLAPLQVLIALLVGPSLTAGTLAGERERGSLDLLLLSRLSPLQIVLGRWMSALGFAILILIAVWPLDALLLLAGVAPEHILVVFGLCLLSVAFTSALGLTVSSWGRRAHLALRSANGIVFGWLLASAIFAALGGEAGIPSNWVTFEPFLWFGRTNPALAALDIARGSAVLHPKWMWSLPFLLVGIPLALWSATRGLKQLPDEAPFLDLGQNPTSSGMMSVPILGKFAARNVVFARELRSRFRMRRPPLGVLLVEGALAIGVAYFYVYALRVALTDPTARPIVFWGVYFTGLIVTLLSCATLGALAFSRERESGTWEGVQLSLLSAREIVWGKFCAVTLTPLLFSLPFWPLVIPCVLWERGLERLHYSAPQPDGVLPIQLAGAIFVWLGSVVSMSAFAMWISVRQAKTSVASGWALGLGVIWTLAYPIGAFIVFDSRAFDGVVEKVVMATTPFFAAAGVFSPVQSDGSGIPFFVFAVCATILLLRHLVRILEDERANLRNKP